MAYIIVLCALISFSIVLLIIPWLINYLKQIGLEVLDMNKEKKPLVPISGGLAVVAGIISGLLVFVFFGTFFKTNVDLTLDLNSLSFLFAGIISILLITLVGFIDDLVIKQGNEGSIGLKQWQKPLLTVIAAIPLMVVGAGFTEMNFPFIGDINFGILYPLLLIPIGVVGASNMVNLLAGFNGMEAGLGIIYTGTLSYYAYVNERHIAALIGLMTFAALIGFYLFNRYPAKILPGDSLTYLLGGVLAVMAIIGNIEKAALIISIPFFIEFFLKLRGRFKPQSYGYYENGRVKSMYKKVYSIPHIFTIKGKFTEKQVVYFMILIQLIFSSLIWFVK